MVAKAALQFVFFVAYLAACTFGEERVLAANLAGYDAYAGRVRWRFVPGVW
jgi:protein-S-isoprenylcysteine O-methyltransferase Ste14